MAFPVTKGLELCKKTLGVASYPSAAGIELINECGEFLVTLYAWKWLERQQVTCNLFKGVPYVKLPLRFPHELRDIVAVAPTGALSSVGWATFGHLLANRAALALEGSFDRMLALTHLPRPAPNLLFETESLHEGSAAGPTWFTSGAPTLTQASAAADPDHPISGLKTTTKIAAPSNTSVFKQSVQAHRLRLGLRYRVSLYLKADPGAVPTRSTLQLTSSAGALRTCVDITWATFVAALRTLTPVSAGAGAHTFKLERLQGGWVRLSADLTYDQVSDDGTLALLVQPIAADLGEANKNLFMTAPQLEAVLPPASAEVFPESPSEYVAVPTSEESYGGEPVPVLEVYPVPSSDDLSGPISFVYRGGWPYVESERDVVSVPHYLNTYFRELLIQWVRGREEEDVMYLSERIRAYLARGNDLLEAAIERDGDVQPEYGRLRNGILAPSGARDWESASSVAGPEDS